jgi:hypothetical protein
MVCYGFKGGIGTALSLVDALPAARLPDGLSVTTHRARRCISLP